MVNAQDVLRLERLPDLLPLDGLVRIELYQGVPVFKASQWVQDRVDALLDKQRTGALTADESRELDGYEEVDDFLGFVNRIVRNAVISSQAPVSTAELP